jgi:hypothetical protein
MEGKTKIICGAIVGIVTMLVIGEALCGAVSRPIAAWRGSKVSASKLVDMLDVIKRIDDLEEKIKGEAE